MSEVHEKLNSKPKISPALCYALGGIFNPESDQKKGEHSLAGLTLAIINDGVKTSKNKVSRSPSWGPDVVVEVVSTPTDRHANSQKELLWIGLHGPDKDVSFTHDRTKDAVIITSSGVLDLDSEREVPISLSSSELVLKQSRLVIAMAAEAFFDTPPPTPELTPESGQV